ncbi:MAG TPA: hypothetical protein VG095_06880, partial [Chthoniobacterales bacterium]|nr:hypothetical protein [Chthoniobacterales bacterium]
TAITRTGPSTINLQGTARPNAANRIESSPDLSPNSFTTLTSIVVNSSGMFQYNDNNAGGAKKFYRVAYP